ncbi:MAG: hypothetical protein J0M36_05170 [Caulobacterales bacterium]|nr:hypothetical protein [Caulobacterales bacterium]
MIWTLAMVGTLLSVPALVACEDAGVSPRPPGASSIDLTVAFVGFTGETVELSVGGKTIQGGKLDTRDRSSSVSGAVRLKSDAELDLHLRIEGSDHRQTVLAPSPAAVLYVDARAPYFQIAEGRTPLLDE